MKHKTYPWRRMPPHEAKEAAIITRALAVIIALFIGLLAVPVAAHAASYEELALVELINDYRASKGLAGFTPSDRLAQAARAHSQDMASKGYFSHTSKNGASFSDRIKAAGYTYPTSLGENIAAGNWKAADVFRQWKESSAHNAIMLARDFKAIGIGRAFNPDAPYQWYWTADFGGVVDSSVKAATCTESEHWAYTYISSLVTDGAVSGYPDGTLRPDNPITRAEFATMAAKAFGIGQGGSKVFSDTRNHWAKGYIAALADRGYVSGYVDGSFRPDAIITRAEMVKILVQAGGLKLQSGAESFRDTSGHWARDYIAIASSNDVVTGYGDGKFRPNAICLRADTATCIYRMVN